MFFSRLKGLLHAYRHELHRALEVCVTLNAPRFQQVKLYNFSQKLQTGQTVVVELFTLPEDP